MSLIDLNATDNSLRRARHHLQRQRRTAHCTNNVAGNAALSASPPMATPPSTSSRATTPTMSNRPRLSPCGFAVRHHRRPLRHRRRLLPIRLRRSAPAHATPAWNVNGFNSNSDVTVSVTAVDNPAAPACKSRSAPPARRRWLHSCARCGSEPHHTADDGATTVSFFATDNAGNQERHSRSPSGWTRRRRSSLTAAAVFIWWTRPSAQVARRRTTPASPQIIVSKLCAGLCLQPLAFYTLSATATDKADNVGSGATSFTVQVTYDSLANLTLGVCDGATPPPGKKKGKAPKVNVAKVAQQLVAQPMKKPKPPRRRAMRAAKRVGAAAYAALVAGAERQGYHQRAQAFCSALSPFYSLRA